MTFHSPNSGSLEKEYNSICCSFISIKQWRSITDLTARVRLHSIAYSTLIFQVQIERNLTAADVSQVNDADRRIYVLLPVLYALV